MNSSRTEGAIQPTLRVGVTGHRKLADPSIVEADVDVALRYIWKHLPEGAKGDTRLVVVSSLAEGADQVVARRVLDHHADWPPGKLEAVLPRNAEDYVTSFEDDASRLDFHDLLHAAMSTTIAGDPAQTQEEQYVEAGHAVIDRADVVIAIWDGEPGKKGGTSDMVQHARETNVHLVWITPDDSRRIELPDVGPTSAGFVPADYEGIAEFNAARLPAGSLAAALDAKRDEFSYQEPLWSYPIDAFVEWIVPPLVRADCLAVRRRRQWVAFQGLLIFLSAVAVLLVTAQAVWEWSAVWAWGEAAALTAILVLYLADRHWRHSHERWIAYRHLSERLRDCFFLALVGASESRPRGPARFNVPTIRWTERAFRTVWLDRPGAAPGESDVAPLTRFLAANWLDAEADYFSRSRSRFVRLERRWRWLRNLLFWLALLVAITHAVGAFHDRHREITFAGLAIPVAAAAIGGWLAQRNYRRHASRYEHMADLLNDLRADMASAQTLPRLQALATEANLVFRFERDEWFGLVRTQELELEV